MTAKYTLYLLMKSGASTEIVFDTQSACEKIVEALNGVNDDTRWITLKSDNVGYGFGIDTQELAYWGLMPHPNN